MLSGFLTVIEDADADALRGLAAMRRILAYFCRAEHGATAVEYALLIGLIALLSVAAWTSIGNALKKIFEYIAGFV
jgi:Flp pilus assembly pilin Flp